MPFIFEIHLTTEALAESALSDFVAFCERIEAKPILIELPAGQQQQQPMISKVVSAAEPGEVHSLLAELRDAFKANGYSVVREKVEVPLEHEAAGKAAFPDYHGGYYEWHGKVTVDHVDALLTLLEYPKAHLSRNTLRGKEKQRFITFRTTSHVSHFIQWVQQIENKVTAAGFPILKSEAEYCCFDSNKSVDRGWSDLPEITDRKYLDLLGYEGFLRRAAKVEGAFMVKGSIISRQYLKEPGSRIPGDLDFVYLEEIHPPEAAAKVFSAWVSTITEIYVDDGLQFRSFRDNDFWRRIDYAMDDDFPTTNTDLLFFLPDGTAHEISIDISWNLPIPQAPEPLIYEPAAGAAFYLERTVPLSLQVAWKLHQTIVRTRTKDLVDLLYLLRHETFTATCRGQTLHALREECLKDGISPTLLMPFLSNTLVDKLTYRTEIFQDEPFKFWQLDDGKQIWALSKYHLQWSFPNLKDKWEDIPDLLRDFSRALQAADITPTDLGAA